MGIDMMECLRGGVSDLRIPGHPDLGERANEMAGPDATGIFSVIGPFQVDLFARAVCATAVSRGSVAPPETATIELRYVLAQPVRFDRLVGAVRDRRDARDSLPVKVRRMTLAGLPALYQVIEGRHRAFVARDAGDNTIAARIDMDYRCEPSAFCLHGDTLMREAEGVRWPVSPLRPWDLPIEAAGAAVTPDLNYTLQALGVRSLPVSSTLSYDLNLARAVHREFANEADNA
jgi:hypothetical protein